MAPSGGALPAGVALLTLLLAPLVEPRFYLSCNIRCCVFSPTCGSATTMTCNCPDVDQLTLRMGSIPETVEYIHVNGVSSVSIAKHSIFSLHNLRELTIRDVRILEVHGDGLAVNPPSQLQLVRVSAVRQVQIHSDALSGHWPADVQLTLQRVEHLRLSRLALHFQSPRPGPRVLFEHVGLLSAQRLAFKAEIGQLSLANVSLHVCQPGTFSGHINNLEMLGCSLQSLEAGCYNSSTRQAARLAVRSSSLSAIKRNALVGDAREVLFEACNISVIEQAGLRMSVDTLELKSVQVQELRPRALAVTARRSVMFRDSRVDELQSQALAGLRLDANAPASIYEAEMRPFSLHSVHVGRAHNGSLAVHPDMGVDQVNWDSLVFDTACSCQLSQLVKQWTAGQGREADTDAQRRFVRLVYRAGFCSSNGRPLALQKAEANCPDRISLDDSDSGASGTGSAGGDGSSLDQNIVFYGVIVAVALLVVVGLSVAICRYRRKRRSTEKRVDTGPPASSAALLDHQTSGGCTAVTSCPSSLARPEPVGKLPDLLRLAPATDAQQEHIYAEIQPAAPQLSEYSDPRDAQPPAAAVGGLYAEISPLVTSGGAPAASAPPPPPPEPAPPPPSTLPAGHPSVMADNSLYGHSVTITDL